MLVYLTEAEVRSALGAIARAFPGCRVAFDTAGEWMAKNQDNHDVLKKMAARMRWICDDPRAIERWGLGLRLLQSRTFADPPPALRPRVPWILRTFGPILFRNQVTSYRLNLFEASP